MTTRAPRTWEEAHEILCELETLKAGTRAQTAFGLETAARGGGVAQLPPVAARAQPVNDKAPDHSMKDLWAAPGPMQGWNQPGPPMQGPGQMMHGGHVPMGGTVPSFAPNMFGGYLQPPVQLPQGAHGAGGGYYPPAAPVNQHGQGGAYNGQYAQSPAPLIPPSVQTGGGSAGKDGGKGTEDLGSLVRVCWNWRDTGTCERGDKCYFSHGETETAGTRKAREKGKVKGESAKGKAKGKEKNREGEDAGREQGSRRARPCASTYEARY